jgi:hypothetical protein
MAMTTVANIVKMFLDSNRGKSIPQHASTRILVIALCLVVMRASVVHMVMTLLALTGVTTVMVLLERMDRRHRHDTASNQDTESRPAAEIARISSSSGPRSGSDGKRTRAVCPQCGVAPGLAAIAGRRSTDPRVVQLRPAAAEAVNCPGSASPHSQ